MQLPIRIEKTAGKSLQSQLVLQLRQLILDGRLAPGCRIPSSREMAADLDISRNTVIGAVARLIAEGLLETREPTGTFVARHICPDGPADTGAVKLACCNKARQPLRFNGVSHLVQMPHMDLLQYDFWVGRPDARLFPLRAWYALLTRVLRNSARHLCEYGDPQGLPQLRAAIAAHVGATRGIATDADHILVTNGIQEGLNLLARLLVAPGTKVAVENPCYRGAYSVFASHGAQLQPVTVDGEGLDPAALPRTAAFAYVTPSHQYPLGVTMPLARRQALLDWAAESGGYIAEDDYDSDFFYDGAPLPALKSLDRNDQVVYFGTFSKSLGAGLRIGYMVLPSELVEPARHAKALSSNCQPWLEQATLAAFFNEGMYAEHLRRLRQLYAARRNHLCTALSHCLPDWQVEGSGCGMHAVVRLPDNGPDAPTMEALARTRGVGVYSIVNGNAQLLNAGRDHPLQRVLLFGYAALDQTEISDAALRLRQVAGANRMATNRAYA
ncbi:MAG: PLP-dependent aminotransferase family protein [Burkholderiales bacterium]|nr:PLP-dependent aminotransferase family protein [Burkholderiales bacterium]